MIQVTVALESIVLLALVAGFGFGIAFCKACQYFVKD